MLALISLYNCHETLDRLDDYVDRELSRRELQLVERHLKICRQCSRKFVFEAALLREMKLKIARLELPANLMTRISLALSQPISQLDQE